MRGLTLTWTAITLVLVILLTSPFPAHTQARERTITKAQIEQVLKNQKPPRGPQPRPMRARESPEQKLKRLLDCTQGGVGCGDRKSLVTKELLLRLQIRDMDEDCTSSDGKYNTAMYFPPYRETREPQDTGPYEAWQDELLDTGLTFCTPIKHLSCSSISKKCECRPGTFWNPSYSPDLCAVILGGYCWIPGVFRRTDFPGTLDDLVALYDPITKDFYGAQQIITSSCQTTNNFQGFNNNGCSQGYQLFQSNVCANQIIQRIDSTFEIQFNALLRLNFEDSCDLEPQTQFFTTTEEEVKDYKIRVKKLDAIVAAKTSFCDLSRLLVCGTAGKCECIKPYVYNNETKVCTIKNLNDACQEQSIFTKMAAGYPGLVPQAVKNGFVVAGRRDCPFGCTQAKFPGGRLVEPGFSFCRPCPEIQDSNGLIQVIGKNCDISLTLILEGAPSPSLPIDVPDYDKQLELFVQFNEKAKEFEKLFRLEKNSPCDYEGELEAYRSIRRIKNVELPEKVFTEKNCKDLMSSMDKHIGLFGEKGLCRYRLRGQPQMSYSDSPPGNRPLLLCGPTDVKPICYELNNTFYLDILMKRLARKSFQAPTSGSCSPHPKDYVKYALEQFPNSVPPNEQFGQRPVPTGVSTDAYAYLFNTLENHWIENSQFCNRSAGINCTKSVYDKTNATGICEFSNDLLEEVLAELERMETDRLAKLKHNIGSKLSFHYLMQHLFSTLLFVLHIFILN